MGKATSTIKVEVKIKTLLMLHTMPYQSAIMLPFAEKLHTPLSISEDTQGDVNILRGKTEIRVQFKRR